MEKIYTVTYCEWESYGSILQSLGLQRFLQTIGYESYILKCETAPRPTLKAIFRRTKNIKQFLLNTYKALIKKSLNKKYIATNEFIRNNIKVIYYDNYESLREKAPHAKAYIAGSDQIWNPTNIKPWFFLDFVKNGIKRISYAASMGVTEIPIGKEEIFNKYISKFDFISVREKDNLPYVTRGFPGKISTNIDPVFLLKQEDWRKYEIPYVGIQKPYILVFAIYWNGQLNDKLKWLHQKTGYNIVTVSNGYQKVYANKRIYDADPAQFLWLIDNAESVISSSFHGISMSILFNKRFSAVINPCAPSRITCLMDNLGVKNLAIKDLALHSEIDYTSVNNKIQEERQRSMDYLKEALFGI